MAERVVSPGVFTNENDKSFLPQGVNEIGTAIIGPTTKGPAFIPTTVDSYSDYEIKFGPSDGKSYVSFALREYLQNAGAATVVKILGLGGYTHTSVAALIASNSIDDARVVGVLHHTTKELGSDLAQTVLTSSVSYNDFGLVLSGSDFSSEELYSSMSLSSTSTKYIGKTIGDNPNSTTIGAYKYVWFKNYGDTISGSVTIDTGTDLSLASDYSPAHTPWIMSQTMGTATYPLFRFRTISDGNASNSEIKVGIANVKSADDVPGSDYGTFSIVIREVGDNDRAPVVLENFNNVTLDPSSPNFIGKLIGNTTWTYNSTEQRNFKSGDFPNRSKYVTVDLNANVLKGSYATTLLPYGFGPVLEPVSISGYDMPAAKMVTSQSYNSLYNDKIYFGFDFDFDNNDNGNYLMPIDANAINGLNTGFNLTTSASFTNQDASLSGSDAWQNSDISGMKFIVPFQGGFDGRNPAVNKNMGTDITTDNVMGYDCSTGTASGSVAYKRSLNLLSDQDLIDINMLLTPGLTYDLHPNPINESITMCEGRADCFYVMDPVAIDTTTLSTVVSTITSIDSSYAATYYPWVKINDVDRNQNIWVPASVMVAGAIAYNDTVGYEWYAPAGLNRGILNAVDIYYPLSQPNRDTLYEGRINPIAFFPNEGISIWGQKTLQALPSALDRVNVRRLLINLKKFIASSTKYLVFEQNTSATRNRFLNIVNPYMETVQQRSGLYAFEVRMDETNNTPDVIDRNQMVGEIFIQPTRTAEFIIIDFNIMPTGANFSE